MNHFSLIGKVETTPDLRYTSNDQTPILEFQVSGKPSNPNESEFPLKVVMFGNAATTAKDTISKGNILLLEGSLRMDVAERPQGFKEKVAEFQANVAQVLSAGGAMASTTSANYDDIPF